MGRNAAFVFWKLERKCSKKAQIIWDRQYLAFCPLKIIVNIVTIEFIQKSVARRCNVWLSLKQAACCEENLISCRDTSQAVVSFRARFCSFSDISMFSLRRFLFIEFHFQMLQMKRLVFEKWWNSFVIDPERSLFSGFVGSNYRLFY